MTRHRVAMMIVIAATGSAGCSRVQTSPPTHVLATQAEKPIIPDPSRVITSPQVTWLDAARRGAVIEGAGFENVLAPDTWVRISSGDREQKPPGGDTRIVPRLQDAGGTVEMDRLFASWRRFCDRADTIQPSDIKLIRENGLLGDQTRAPLRCEANTPPSVTKAP